jgi:murein DD-endopeptidase MepM/ murein hydrolase activator NlpD
MSRPLTAARVGGLATAYAVAVLVALPAASGALTPASGTGGATQPPPDPVSPVSSTSPTTATSPQPGKLGTTPFGVPPMRPAHLRSLRCLEGCADATTPMTDARLRVRGRGLSRTDTVDFLGAPGGADDIEAKPLRVTRRAVDVRVPLGAAGGPVTVADRDGIQAAAPLSLSIAVGRSAAAPRTLVAAGPQIEVQVASPRAFFDSAVPAHVTYVLHGGEPAPVTVEVVDDADGTTVASWPAGIVAPETPQTASWDGMVDGHAPRAGRYSFRVTATMGAAGAAQGVSSQAAEPVAGSPDDPASFVFLRNVFPVRGPHYYGEGPARFGGGRGHQGQDVFATCGTPLVAARGGRVKFRGFQSAAGNYLIIDAAHTGIDYGYMHLRSRALVKPGERVRTGQPIGYVGDTGDASACHLHLELWTAPGWYHGGAPFDPLPSLRAWDRTS